MVKESMRKCSHCGHNGHNARTCNEKGTTSCMRLFGVRIVADSGNNNVRDESQPMRKCVSLGNLELKALASAAAADAYDGYLSDGPVHSLKRTTASERKKGVPWSMEEHRDFLAGLEKLGKGDWRGISKNFVTTRTPAQVASHAQKYFIRLGLSDKKKKKRSSLFDLPLQNDAIATELPSPSLTDKTPLVAPSPTANVSAPPPMANVSAKYANALYPVAAGASNLHEVPYMVRFPSQSFPAAGTFTAVPMPFFPMMKFPSQGPVYVPSSADFLTCAPIASFPAVGSHHQPSHPAQTSSARRDGLELGIALPENQDVSNLSSQPSGPIGVI